MAMVKWKGNTRFNKIIVGGGLFLPTLPLQMTMTNSLLSTCA
jgi:hypothetical protein